MARHTYLELARRGLRMPVATDLTLHEEMDPEAVRSDAAALGGVVERTARRYHTPLAIPLMDLTLEKSDLLAFFGVPPHAADSWHFSEPPSEQTVTRLNAASARPFSRRIDAQHGAIRLIAETTDLVPVGMVIGPFSLMTKLVADPIIPVATAAMGVTGGEDPGVALVERCLALAEATIRRSASAQIANGARAVMVCEPAANSAYLSPRQLRTSPETFERFVLGPNQRLKALLDAHGVDLIFHNCGQLTREMVQQFAGTLHPVILSLGSSRRLWEDAAVVPDDVVLYGNLPTRLFYSDTAMPEAEVRRQTGELLQQMADCGHPHILGSECDVLHVPGASDTIHRKVNLMLTVH